MPQRPDFYLVHWDFLLLQDRAKYLLTILEDREMERPCMQGRFPWKWTLHYENI